MVYKCGHIGCKAQFKTKGKLMNHIRTAKHKNSKTVWKCGDCPGEFETKHDLLNHINSEHKSQENKISNTEDSCHYHSCEKIGHLNKCKYCGNLFCDEHIKPKPPAMPRFSSTNVDDRLLMEEYRKPGGHPCPPFLEEWDQEQKRKGNVYENTLNNLTRSQKPLYKEIEGEQEEKQEKKHSMKKIKDMGIDLSKFKPFAYFIIWVFIHSFSVWLSGIALLELKFTDFWIQLIGTGIIITLIAQFYRITYGNEFEISRGLLYWVVVNTITFGTMNFLVSRLTIQNPWLNILLIGLGLAFVGKFVPRSKGHNRSSYNYDGDWKLAFSIIALTLIIYFCFIYPIGAFLGIPLRLIDIIQLNLALLGLSGLFSLLGLLTIVLLIIVWASASYIINNVRYLDLGIMQIVALVMCFAFIYSVNVGYINIENIIKNPSQIFNGISSIGNEHNCKYYALQLIPEKFNLTDTAVNGWTITNDNKWKDGSSISANYLGLVYFKQGTNQGQNINYYYFDESWAGFSIGNNSLDYSKRIISENGIVLGTRTFSIKPIVKPIPETNKANYGIWGQVISHTQEFEVLDPNLVSCHWVTDDGKIIT